MTIGTVPREREGQTTQNQVEVEVLSGLNLAISFDGGHGDVPITLERNQDGFGGEIPGIGAVEFWLLSDEQAKTIKLTEGGQYGPRRPLTNREGMRLDPHDALVINHYVDGNAIRVHGKLSFWVSDGKREVRVDLSNYRWMREQSKPSSTTSNGRNSSSS